VSNEGNYKEEMMMGAITVVAQLKAKKGMEDLLKQELLSIVEPSRSDAGCLNYDLHQSMEDSSSFLFYENWTGREALDAHLGTEHIKTFRERAEGLLAEPTRISLWEMKSEKR
jgi:quinol monooxygenase YgiN